MRKLLVVLLFLYLFAEGLSVEEYYRFVDHAKFRYVIDDPVYSFDKALSWCREMGGDLPAIHDDEDLDFLADAVYDTLEDKNQTKLNYVWIGVKANNGECSHYTDGSDVDFNFTYIGFDCSLCPNCAMLMHIAKHHKIVFFFPKHDPYNHAVCVIKEYDLFNISQEQSTIFAANISALEYKTNDQFKQMKANIMQLISQLESDVHLKMTLLIILCSILIIAILVMLLFRRRSVNSSENVGMIYQSGVYAVSSLDPPVYQTKHETVSPTIINKS